MCTTATATRRRSQAKNDKRYKPGKDKSKQRAFQAMKAAKEGRSFSYKKR